MEGAHLASIVVKGFLVTVAIEIVVLCIFLSRRHSIKRRIFAGLWLTAVSYPFVTLVFPQWFDHTQYRSYVLLSEIFAPVSECLLFLAVYLLKDLRLRLLLQDFAAIVLANLASYLFGVAILAFKIPLFK